MKKILALTATLLATQLLASTAHAVLFKCKDAAGKTTYQETPCAKNEAQKKIAKDADADTRRTSTGESAGAVVSESANDKRIHLNRQASADTVAACITFHRADLISALPAFQVKSTLSKRHWLTTAGPAERLMINISIREKNKLFDGEQIDFACMLRGNETVDPEATRAHL
jgi:Domain of unknown function (DUF4124)